MGKRQDTWMPLYIGDYLRDTGRLTTEGHGAYLLLIMDYWASGGALPDDDEILATVTRLPAKSWMKLRHTISAFFEIRDGKWHHKRIDAELVEASERAAKRSAAGKENAVRRWSKSDANGNANGIRLAMQNGCEIDARAETPSPSPYPTDITVANATDATASENRSDDLPKPSPDAPRPDEPVQFRGSLSPGVANDLANQPKTPIDLRKSIFTTGLGYLRKAGMVEENARSMLGKWRSDFGDAAVIAAIASAEAEDALQPIEFIAGCLRKSNGNARKPARESADDKTARIRAGLADAYMARQMDRD